VDGRVPVAAGISAPTPELAIAHATDAAEAGARGAMLLPPQLYGADESEVLAFFAAVAESISLPLMVYNNPEASGTDLKPAVLALAADIDGIVAIKETSGDARRIAELVFAVGDRVDVLVGGDDCALEGAATGAVGWVSGVANVAPVECISMWNAATTGNLSEARELYRRLLPLAQLDMTPKLVQYFKAALAATGREVGVCRPPRLTLNARELERLRDAVDALGPIASLQQA
jgi:4-hydroxy-tetrahydrodipicolinate synthase